MFKIMIEITVFNRIVPPKYQLSSPIPWPIPRSVDPILAKAHAATPSPQSLAGTHSLLLALPPDTLSSGLVKEREWLSRQGPGYITISYLLTH